ncbi:MAG: hypothetical protein ACD_79C00716G0003 [uncultured bacterium]|nr:MAG: hypothetical protein ACD_79C00716G0003 [uncultured bacterium]
MFFFKKNKLPKIFISIFPKAKGGGANTFAWNFISWLKKNKNKFNYEKNILKADNAIIIANKIDIDLLKKSKENGCFIIHRLDEHFEENEDEYRKTKHSEIIKINKLADVTVYQSNFVFENVHPYLKPDKYKIVINGALKEIFHPAKNPGEYIGHVSWGIGEKKRYDILYKFIECNPDFQFLLVGNHNKSGFNFGQLKNTKLISAVKRNQIVKYYHKMKILYFPSENDPCPNTVVEAILSGVPVCYNEIGGTREIVKDCGASLSHFTELIDSYSKYRENCFHRNDLFFENVANQYVALFSM